MKLRIFINPLFFLPRIKHFSLVILTFKQESSVKSGSWSKVKLQKWVCNKSDDIIAVSSMAAMLAQWLLIGRQCLAATESCLVRLWSVGLFWDQLKYFVSFGVMNRMAYLQNCATYFKFINKTFNYVKYFSNVQQLAPLTLPKLAPLTTLPEKIPFWDKNRREY